MGEARKKSKSRVKVKCPECDTVFLPSVEETQSRAGASARRKGATFERNVAKKLKKWWPGDHDFKRTPQSGGSALKEGWGLAGDIATTAPDFPWHIECKNAPGTFKGWHQFFSAEKWTLWRWLKQAKHDCPDNRIPMLIVNRFDQPTYCLIDADTDHYIQDRIERSGANFIMLMTGSKMLYVWKLDDLLKSDPELWKQ